MLIAKYSLCNNYSNSQNSKFVFVYLSVPLFNYIQIGTIVTVTLEITNISSDYNVAITVPVMNNDEKKNLFLSK